MCTWSYGRGFALGVVLVLTNAACGGIAIVDGEPGEGGGSTTTSSTSGGSLDVELVAAFGSANCQPEIAADPLNVSVVLVFSNFGISAASAQIGEVRLSSSVGDTSFSVSPSSVGPVDGGDSLEVDFDKAANSAQGTSGCDYCNAIDLSLSVAVTSGGDSQLVTGPMASMSCSF